MALRNIGADFETWRVVEFDKYAIASYNAVHGTDYPAIDINDVSGADLGIEEKDKYTYLLTYSFPCFVGDTLVLTNEGFKKISDVDIEDFVLTNDNSYQKVLESKCTGRKAIYSVKGMCFDEIRCTENHKFYVRKMVRHYPTYENGKRGRTREFLQPEYVECNKLDKTYYMGIAINNNSIVPEWNGIDFEWSDGRKTRHKNDIGNIIGKYDFWWIIGRYVGDGWNRSQGGIIICSDKKETGEIITVAERLNLKYSISAERTVDKVHFSSKELGKFVIPFGKGAENKRVPGFVFDLPKNLVKGFVDGYVSADGCFTQGVYKTSSVSKELSYGIGQLVAKSYNVPFRIYKNRRKPTSEIEGRVVKQKDAYSVVWKTEKRRQDKAFYEDGYIWFPIQDIKSTEEMEDVYDIEVEKNHSFTANGAIVHNCTDLSVAGLQMGMSEDSGTRSSLLWQVKRILTECKDNLPQILMMENVPAIHNHQNIRDFRKWLDFLDSLGYSSYMQDLNAWDYGLAQSRDRTFVISILGNYNYKFPEMIDNLKYCIEDYFEDLTEEQALQLVVKSDKALDLLVRLDDEGKLE